MQTLVKSKGKSPRIKRTALIKIFSAFVVAIFIITPSLLHYYAGIGVSPILTGSMRPYVQPGDVLVTKSTKASEVKVGDVVALVSQETGIFYAHRVIDIRDINGTLRMVTKGDANAAADLSPYMASPNAIVPRNIGRVIWLGYPLVYLTSIQGRQASLSLIVTANVIALLLFLFREKIKEISERAYHLYRDLYVEAQLARAEKEREARVFRELFNEERDSQKELEHRSNIYKDLFLQSQEEKQVNEAEIAQLMQEMNEQQPKKENK